MTMCVFSHRGHISHNFQHSQHTNNIYKCSDQQSSTKVRSPFCTSCKEFKKPSRITALAIKRILIQLKQATQRKGKTVDCRS